MVLERWYLYKQRLIYPITIRRNVLGGILSKPLAETTGIRLVLTKLTQITGKFVAEIKAGTNPSTYLQLEMHRRVTCCHRRDLL